MGSDRRAVDRVCQGGLLWCGATESIAQSSLPLGQEYKCYSEFVPMETFLKRFINDNTRTRIHEPVNGYNADDPGMQIVAPLINAALAG